MQVILQGSLRHFAVADLLNFLLRPGHKGTLDLESSGRRTRIHFENETILGAQSKKADGADAVIDVLEWNEGSFTVLDAVVLPEGTQPLALTLAAVHEEAKRKAEERNSGFPDQTLFRVVEDPALQQQVSLTADEFRLLFRLAAGRTFHELLAEFAVPRKELAERLKHLQGLGLIAIEGPAETQKPAAEAAAAPQAAAPQVTAAPQAAAPSAEPVTEPNIPPPDVSTIPITPPLREQDIKTIAEMPIPALPNVEQEAERTMMQAPPPDVPPAPRPPKTPTIVGSLTPDDAPDNVFPLLDAECIIGRKQTKDVSFAVNDGSISSRHARLQRTPEGFYIEDLGSKNGTFVNGEKVTDKRLLADGDLIRLGKVIMTFNVARESKRSDTTVPEIRVD